MEQLVSETPDLDWRAQLLRSRSFTTRLLPANASAEIAKLGQPDDFQTFLERLLKADRSLAIDGLDLLVGPYLQFLRVDLPEFLSRMRTTQRMEITETGPAVMGRPIWGRTVQRWKSGTLPIGRYVSRIQRRSLDLPENFALKGLVKNLKATASLLIGRLGPFVHSAVLAINAAASAALKDPWLSQVTDGQFVSEATVRAAESARETVYRTGGKLLRRRIGLSNFDELGRWRRAALAAAIGESALIPVEPESLFELLALATTLDVLEADLGLGPPVSFWMRIATGAASGPVARFSTLDGSMVDVFFNRSPAILSEHSTNYRKIFEAHSGLGQFSDRRPDVVVINQSSGRLAFVEAKLPGSSLPSSYLRESIYKGFGYLYDFKEFWPSDQVERVALFVPLAVSTKAEASSTELHVVSAQSRSDLANFLSTSLGIARSEVRECAE